MVTPVRERIAQLDLHYALVKCVGPALWLVFASGEQALAALSANGLTVNGHQLSVVLRSHDWAQTVAAEMRAAHNAASAELEDEMSADDDASYDQALDFDIQLDGVDDDG